MKLKFIIIVVCGMIFGKCSNKKTSEAQNTNGEDYKTFISHFNNDTTFQKSRVRYKFDKYNNLSLTNIDTTLFNISTLISDSVTVKIILKENTSYWVEYIFKKENDKWYMTDYIDTYDE